MRHGKKCGVNETKAFIVYHAYLRVLLSIRLCTISRQSSGPSDSVIIFTLEGCSLPPEGTAGVLSAGRDNSCAAEANTWNRKEMF